MEEVPVSTENTIILMNAKNHQRKQIPDIKLAPGLLVTVMQAALSCQLCSYAAQCIPAQASNRAWPFKYRNAFTVTITTNTSHGVLITVCVCACVCVCVCV